MLVELLLEPLSRDEVEPLTDTRGSESSVDVVPSLPEDEPYWRESPFRYSGFRLQNWQGYSCLTSFRPEEISFSEVEGSGEIDPPSH